MPPPPRRLLALLAAFAALVAIVPWAGTAAAAASVTKELGPVTISPGVEFSRYKVVQSSGAYAKVHVLEIDPATSATVDVGYATPHLPGESDMSSFAPAQDAVAAINGDFGHGRPDHAYLQDATLWQSALRKGGLFGVRQDEARAFAGAPRVSVSINDGNQITRINNWNAGPPGKDELAGFSPEAGNTEDPPGKACSARLSSPGPLEWSAGQKGLQRNYVVQTRRCKVDPLPEKGKIVISSRRGDGSLDTVIKGLAIGQLVRLKFSFGMPGVVDAMGGTPVLMKDGAIPTLQTCATGPLWCQHNRSSVGINQACTTGGAGCRIFYVVVDSRLNNWSQGMTLIQLANFYKNELEAWDVLNMDGGGSAGMWVKANAAYPAQTCQFKSTSTGCFVNKPVWKDQTPTERQVENALLVKAGADLFPGAEPVPLGP
ncbi:MAG: phosphodiester glycosidase family protein [Actinomycetota bacterium]